MTRNQQSLLGSIGRCLKTASVAVCMLLATTSETATAMETNYRIRIHKHFMKNVLDKNFPVILDHIESKFEKDIFLTEVNAKIDELKLSIVPSSHSEHRWDKLESDLFYDQG